MLQSSNFKWFPKPIQVLFVYSVYKCKMKFTSVSVSIQDSIEGEVINPEFVVFNDTGNRFELLMKVSCFDWPQSSLRVV